ncbi:UNKNOWN [Stylonychia lemnae]|uniref:Uncharacterized protein n=1 Tax=Stylonychia lemnae TaxID=5949 RepID=A0A078A819_STYLE|nr:UNKNOWN [Stylonychia lemnae]|eukprot:CDW78395.1 UNKNOWN [Stylonychia lemnae]
MSFGVVFIIGLVLIAATYLFWYYMQPWQMYKVDITQEKIQKRRVLYKEFKGSYTDIKDTFDNLLELIEKTKKVQGTPMILGDIIQQLFGVYYDNPDKLADESQSKAIYGVIIPDGISREKEEALIGFFVNRHGFKLGELPESDGLHGKLPNEEYYFYVLRNLEFQPVMKGDLQQMKIWYQEYQKHQEKGEGCQMEIYDKDSIHFYLPITNMQPSRKINEELALNDSSIQKVEEIYKKTAYKPSFGSSAQRNSMKQQSHLNNHPQYKPLPVLTKVSLEPVRQKLDKYIQSLPGDKKIEHKYVMKVKGKCLNNFLGIIKTDLTKLSVEGFPQELNKQLPALKLLNKYDLIWFDIQIEQRVATLKANFFVGYNLGQNTYKMGFMCLIGIAHLPDSMNKLRFYRGFDIRPTLSTDISQNVLDEMQDVPKHAALVTMNLFQAIKMISTKIIDRLPISGNVKYEDDRLLLEEEQRLMKLYQEEEMAKLMTRNINETMYLDEFLQGEEEGEDQQPDELEEIQKQYDQIMPE